MSFFEYRCGIVLLPDNGDWWGNTVVLSGEHGRISHAAPTRRTVHRNNKKFPAGNLLGLDRLDVNERFAQRNGGGVPCFVSRPSEAEKDELVRKAPSASGISTKISGRSGYECSTTKNAGNSTRRNPIGLGHPTISTDSIRASACGGGWRSGSGRWTFRSRAKTTGSSWPLAAELPPTPPPEDRGLHVSSVDHDAFGTPNLGSLVRSSLLQDSHLRG